MPGQPFVMTLLAAAALAATGTAETVDSILAGHIEARGGASAVEAVESARISGTLTLDGRVSGPCTVEWKRPDRFRLEYTLNGVTRVDVFDGESGWSIRKDADGTSQDRLSGKELEWVKAKADYFDGVLVGHRLKGHSIELLGKETVEGAEAYKLHVTRADGNTGSFFIDLENHRLIKEEGTTVSGLGFARVFSKYRKTGDILLAHRVDVTMRPTGGPRPHGMKQRFTIKSATLGVDIDDSRFSVSKSPSGE